MADPAMEESLEPAAPVDAEAMDSLHTLPLSIIPLKTAGLKNPR
jgi:hypothetical protein